MLSQCLFRERLSLVPKIPSTQSLGKPEHHWGCPNSALGLKASLRSQYTWPPPKTMPPPPSHRAACGHGPQDRPGTRACSVPELVEQVSWGGKNKGQRRCPGARVCWPSCPQLGQPSDSHWGQGVSPPSVGGQGWGGEGHP